MKMQRARWLLVSGAVLAWLAWASAATAGPGGTTTTTTTVPGSTTTTTTGPPTSTTTTTTGVPTTTTTTTTTTAPTTSSTTTTSTTSTTLPPTPEGENQYLQRLGRSLYEDSQLATDVGEGFCVVGRIRGTDATLFPLRRVSFEYRSIGSTQKLSDKGAKGDFSSVDLSLVIEEDGTGTLFSDTVAEGCRLKAALNKEGERAKSDLRCDLGPDLSAFGLSDELLANVHNAFPKREGTGVKVDPSKGHVRVKLNGDEAPEHLFDETLSCFFD